MDTLSTFHWPIRVYYEDTDAGGVVYHSQYLNFMERARTEWLRHFGFEQPWLKDELGILFVVHSMQINFKKPAHFNDALDIQSTPTQIGFSSMIFTQTILREAEVLAEASIKLACVKVENFKPVAIPALIKQKISPSSCFSN